MAFTLAFPFAVERYIELVPSFPNASDVAPEFLLVVEVDIAFVLAFALNFAIEFVFPLAFDREFACYKSRN